MHWMSICKREDTLLFMSGSTRCDEDIPTFSLHPPHVPAFWLLVYSCASLLGLFFYFHPLSFSSPAIAPFIPHFLLSFGELLSYLFLSCGLERKQTGTEQRGEAIPLHNRHTLNPVISPPLLLPVSPAFNSCLYSSIFNSDFPSVSHCSPQRFHFSPSVVCDPLHLFSISTSISVFLQLWTSLLPFSLSHTHNHLFFLLTVITIPLLWLRRPIWGSSWTSSSTIRWTKCLRCWREASIPTTRTVTLVVRQHSYKHKHPKTSDFKLNINGIHKFLK